MRSPFIFNLGIFDARARIFGSLRHLLQKVSWFYQRSLQYRDVLHQVADVNCLQKPCALSDLPLKNKISCDFFGATECLRECMCGISLVEPWYSEIERENFCLVLSSGCRGLVSLGRSVASWRVNEIKEEI